MCSVVFFTCCFFLLVIITGGGGGNWDRMAFFSSDMQDLIYFFSLKTIGLFRFSLSFCFSFVKFEFL